MGLHQLSSWAVPEECSLQGGWCGLSAVVMLCLSPFLQACGGSIQTSVNALSDDVLGCCELFEETQIGGER